jgi:hypothetical protein
MTELLRAGLAASHASSQGPTPPKSAPFPIVKCRHRARPEDEMMPERVAEMMQAQDVKWHEKSGR